MSFRQVASYGLVGVLSALIDVGFMKTALMLGAGHIVASTLGSLLSLVLNYVMQMKITFQSAHDSKAVVRYLVVVGFNYLIALSVVHGAYVLGQDPVVGKILSLPIIACVGFFASKFWIYK